MSYTEEFWLNVENRKIIIRPREYQKLRVTVYHKHSKSIQLVNNNKIPKNQSVS